MKQHSEQLYFFNSSDIFCVCVLTSLKLLFLFAAVVPFSPAIGFLASLTLCSVGELTKRGSDKLGRVTLTKMRVTWKVLTHFLNRLRF